MASLMPPEFLGCDMSRPSPRGDRLAAKAAAKAAANGELAKVGRNPYRIQDLSDRFEITVPPVVAENTVGEGEELYGAAYWDAERGVLVYDLEVIGDGDES